jgi:5-methylcytosine-specific restriction protein A
MPMAPKRRCPRCPNFMPCPVHTGQRTERAAAWLALYNDRRWKRYRLSYLADHPLCCDPFGRHAGRLIPATVVDHITPHRGDVTLFWDGDNHRALCGGCNSYAAAKYQGGFGNTPAPVG